MKVNKNLKKIVLAVFIMFSAYSAYSANCYIKCQPTTTANSSLNKIYKFAKKISKHSVPNKVAEYSKYFLGTPYRFAQAELDHALVPDITAYLQTLAYQPEFNYNLQAMDCVHYVETVLALALVENRDLVDIHRFEQSFIKQLKTIRYKDGKDTFLARNHFTSLDWIPNNAQLLEDITAKLQPQHLVATATIDKCGFLYYQPKIKAYATAQRTLGIEFNQRQMAEILAGLAPDMACKKQKAMLPYITLPDFIDNYSKYVQLFPESGIVNIVRPNWDLTKVIGSHLNVSHQGFVIKKNNTLLFRHASSDGNKTITEIDLKEYLTKFLPSPTIKGINVLELRR